MNTIHFLDPHPSGAKPILLLHGLGANGASWQLQFDALIENGFRPIAPDVPGFGESPYDGKGWSIKRAAAQMIGLLDELKIAHADVAGLSMGGVIASQSALDYPDRIKHLVLVSTFDKLRPSNASEFFYFLRRLIFVHLIGLPQQAKLVAERVFPHPEQEELRALLIAEIARADIRAYRSAMRSLGMFNIAPRLKEIKMPALVITGMDDTTVAPHVQRRLADGIGAQQIVIANGGHAINVDQYGQFNEALIAFVRRL
jgi:3-oxoadipate enol-lactonase